ncbi:aromatic compound dioxygenase [Trametopsis cervina]|nr:aromatic compound dioxygenase [Trametopsis cervina]
MVAVPKTWVMKREVSARSSDKTEDGPYYLIGAPQREFEDGKIILASGEELQKNSPLLLTLHIRGPSGEPVKNAQFDWWQADTAGVYSTSTYMLRGKFKTNEQGDIEILTVVPGKYGPADHRRAGHMHLILTDPDGKFSELTTQLYVCRGNDSSEMNTDFLNFIRSTRPSNMLHCWTTKEDFMDLPKLSSDDAGMLEIIKWWNTTLAELGVNAAVIAGAEAEIRMNA